MHVAVLGSGVIGTTIAYYLARDGHQVTVARPAAGTGAGDELRQCRRGLARLLVALGRPGRPGQGDQVDADDAQPAGDLAAARLRDVALGLVDADELHRARLPAQQEPHGADRRVQPRLPEAAARRHRHRLRRADAGHAAAVSHAEAARRHRQGHRDPEGVRRALRGARPRRLLPGRAGTGAHAAEVRRRAAAAERRDRRLLQVHAARSPTLAPATRRDVPLRHADRRP